jgi:tRNA pseudouridine55 synthase
VFRLDVVCSTGTYIRTLADDIGRALGGGAHLRNLRRTAIGSFTLDEARPLGDLLVRPMVDVMRDYPSVVASETAAVAVGFGKVLHRADLDLPAAGDDPAASGPWAVLDRAGDLLAVYEAHKGTTVKPSVVVAPATGRPSTDGAGRPPAEGASPAAE